jgi:hypothetical protein
MQEFLPGARDVVQVIEHLPSKHKVLCPNLNTVNKSIIHKKKRIFAGILVRRLMQLQGERQGWLDQSGNLRNKKYILGVCLFECWECGKMTRNIPKCPTQEMK